MADTDTSTGSGATGAAQGAGSALAGLTVPVVLSGKEVYDKIMSQIEPELTTDQLLVLKDRYAADTPEQTEERAARYSKAFEEYDKQYAAYEAQQQASARTFQHDVLAATEHSVDDSSSTMSGLEAAMNAA